MKNSNYFRKISRHLSIFYFVNQTFKFLALLISIKLIDLRDQSFESYGSLRFIFHFQEIYYFIMFLKLFIQFFKKDFVLIL